MSDDQQQTGQQPGQPATREPGMTAARLAAIWERSYAALIREPVTSTKFAGMVASLEDVPDLLAFAEAALPILEELAAFSGVEYPLPFTWLPDGRMMAVMPDNLRTAFAQARALLAGMAEGTAEGAESADEGSAAENGEH